MDFRAQVTSLDQLSAVTADALVLVVGQWPLDPSLDPALAAAVTRAVEAGDFEIKAGRSLYLHGVAGVKAPRVLLCAAPGLAPKAFRNALAAAVGTLKPLGAASLAVALADGAATALHAELFVTTISDALYVYRLTKPSAPKPSALKSATLHVAKPQAEAARRGLRIGEAVAAGVEEAREWGNRPGNHCRPRDLGNEAKRLAKAHGFKVQVMDRKAIEELGMGSFLAVAQGSEEPPRFIVLRHDGGTRGDAPVVLIGKGITFDTGGISIKPAADMDEMKWDMSGAASVLGTFRALAALKPRLNVVGLIAATENMPDGRAVKPGDVVTSLSGQTIEILNTDAEGRLVLCDALTYAERLKPAAVVDIATLTGACVIALGHHHSGLFASDDTLAAELQQAGEAALDPCWRMPLDEEYDEALKSNFADMANVGGRAGGAITAAKFLQRYAGKFGWAHLDIAGTAWKSGGAAKGSTGRPVPLLTHFLLARAGA